MYTLSLHWKQGDDLDKHLENAASPSTGLRSWGQSFKHHQEICERIAKAIEGSKITIQCNTHMIMFEPGDEAGDLLLQFLVKEELLEFIDFDAVE